MSKVLIYQQVHVAVVFTSAGGSDDGAAADGNDRYDDDGGPPTPEITIPYSVSKRLAFIGSIRTTAGDGRMNAATARLSSRNFQGAFLRADCVPGYRLNPNLTVVDLPLWRVGWVETPGRRNCLNVHEMHYTHMFERILASSRSSTDDDDDCDGLYFGHLYLPGGTSSASGVEERYRLKTWREELSDADRFDDYDSTSTLAEPVGGRTPAAFGRPRLRRIGNPPLGRGSRGGAADDGGGGLASAGGMCRGGGGAARGVAAEGGEAEEGGGGRGEGGGGGGRERVRARRAGDRPGLARDQLRGRRIVLL